MDLSARSICPCSGCAGAAWPRSQVSLDDVTRWPGACHPPRPRYQASLIGPLGAAPEKKSGMFIEKAGSLSEEVKTWGDVVQVCVVSGHSSWYANVLVHRTLQQLISNFTVLNKVSNFCVEKKRFLSGIQSTRGFMGTRGRNCIK